MKATMKAEAANATCEPSSVARGQGVARDTLYFDGQCPLCASEIEALAEARGDALRLVDIHTQTAVHAQSAVVDDSLRARGDDGADVGAVTRPTPTVDELLRTLHLQRADGTWLTGADANVAAWEGTRRGRALRALRWPLLRPFVDLGYRIWAFWRYRRLYGRQFDAERDAP